MGLIGRLNLNALHILGLTLHTPPLGADIRGSSAGRRLALLRLEFRKVPWKASASLMLRRPRPVAPSDTNIPTLRFLLNRLTPGKPSKDGPGDKQAVVPYCPPQTRAALNFPLGLC